MDQSHPARKPSALEDELRRVWRRGVQFIDGTPGTGPAGRLPPLPVLEQMWAESTSLSTLRRRRDAVRAMLSAALEFLSHEHVGEVVDKTEVDAVRLMFGLDETHATAQRMELWGLVRETVLTTDWLGRRQRERAESSWRQTAYRRLARALAVADRYDFSAAFSRTLMVPRALPPRPALLVGREFELDLVSVATGGGSCCLVGGPGVGKTAISSHWAHANAGEYSDGVLFVPVGTHSPGQEPRTVRDILQLVLRTFGVRYQSGAPTDELAVIYSTLLATQRIMLILDDVAVRDAEFAVLLPGLGKSVVLCTSRERPSELISGVRPWTVEVTALSRLHGTELLRGWLPDRVDLEPEAAIELIELCGGNPLALSLAASELARSPRKMLKTIVAELKHRRSVLDLGADTTTAVREVIKWSYDRLDRAAKIVLVFTAAMPMTGVPEGFALKMIRVFTEPDSSGKSLEWSEFDYAHAWRELHVRNLLHPVDEFTSAAHDLVREVAAEVDVNVSFSELKRIFLSHYLIGMGAVASDARGLDPRSNWLHVELYEWALSLGTDWLDSQLNSFRGIGALLARLPEDRARESIPVLLAIYRYCRKVSPTVGTEVARCAADILYRFSRASPTDLEVTMAQTIAVDVRESLGNWKNQSEDTVFDDAIVGWLLSQEEPGDRGTSAR